MDLLTTIQNINYWAVIVAAIAAWLLGMLWYSPYMFASSWIEENKLSKDALTKERAWHTPVLSFALFFVSSWVLALIVYPTTELSEAVNWSVVIGLGLLGAFFAVHHRYEQKSMRLFIINAGYNAFALLIAGIIIGLWK